MEDKMKNFNNLKSTFQDSIFTWDYFTDFEKVKKFEKWMRKKLKNVHVGNNERMCNAYEIVIA